MKTHSPFLFSAASALSHCKMNTLLLSRDQCFQPTSDRRTHRNTLSTNAPTDRRLLPSVGGITSRASWAVPRGSRAGRSGHSWQSAGKSADAGSTPWRRREETVSRTETESLTIFRYQNTQLMCRYILAYYDQQSCLRPRVLNGRYGQRK